MAHSARIIFAVLVAPYQYRHKFGVLFNMEMKTLNEFKDWLNSGTDHSVCTRGKRGAIRSHLDKVFGGDERRKAFYAWAGWSNSTTTLTDIQANRVYEWMAPYSPEDEADLRDGYSFPEKWKYGQWIVRAKCYETAAELNRQVEVEQGQMELV